MRDVQDHFKYCMPRWASRRYIFERPQGRGQDRKGKEDRGSLSLNSRCGRSCMNPQQPDDPELEAIRQRRMAELMGQASLRISAYKIHVILSLKHVIAAEGRNLILMHICRAPKGEAWPLKRNSSRWALPHRLNILQQSLLNGFPAVRMADSTFGHMTWA